MTPPIKIENYMDIRELVLMSIGTDKGKWWADETFGSELWTLRQEGKLNNKTAGVVQRMIRECLQWIIDDGLASDISVEVNQTSRFRIAYCVTVLQPNGNTEMIKEVWDGVRS